MRGSSSRVLVLCGVSSGFCDELITRSEESYRVCVSVCVVCVCLCVSVCVSVCDLEPSTKTRPGPEFDYCATEKGRKIYGSFAYCITT